MIGKKLQRTVYVAFAASLLFLSGCASMTGTDTSVKAAPVDLSGVYHWVAHREDYETAYTPYSRADMNLNERGKMASENFVPESSPLFKCVGIGPPLLPYTPYPFKIIQSEDRILIRYEFANVLRIVYLNDDHEIPPMSSTGNSGYSRGHFEGKTLVVETTGFSHDTVGLWEPVADDSRIGIPSSNQKKITERYTLSEDKKVIDLVQYVEDPFYLIEPFETKHQGFDRISDDILPYECDPAQAGAPAEDGYK